MDCGWCRQAGSRAGREGREGKSWSHSQRQGPQSRQPAELQNSGCRRQVSTGLLILCSHVAQKCGLISQVSFPPVSPRPNARPSASLSRSAPPRRSASSQAASLSLPVTIFSAPLFTCSWIPGSPAPNQSTLSRPPLRPLHRPEAVSGHTAVPFYPSRPMPGDVHFSPSVFILLSCTSSVPLQAVRHSGALRPNAKAGQIAPSCWE